MTIAYDYLRAYGCELLLKRQPRLLVAAPSGGRDLVLLLLALPPLPPATTLTGATGALRGPLRTPQAPLPPLLSGCALRVITAAWPPPGAKPMSESHADGDAAATGRGLPAAPPAPFFGFPRHAPPFSAVAVLLAPQLLRARRTLASSGWKRGDSGRGPVSGLLAPSPDPAAPEPPEAPPAAPAAPSFASHSTSYAARAAANASPSSAEDAPDASLWLWRSGCSTSASARNLSLAARLRGQRGTSKGVRSQALASRRCCPRQGAREGAPARLQLCKHHLPVPQSA